MKTKGANMLYSITKEGKIKIHRDLSKWRRRQIGKRHFEYFEEAPSSAEKRANEQVQALISQQTKELSLDQECAVAVVAMKRQEYKDRQVG